MGKKKHAAHTPARAKADAALDDQSVVDAAPQKQPSTVHVEDDTAADEDDALVRGSPTSEFASEFGKKRVHSTEVQQQRGEVLQPRASKVPAISRKFSERTARAFLPDAEVGNHFVFRALLWVARWYLFFFNSFEMVGMEEQPRDKAILFFTRHSTHNQDILAVLARCYLITGRVTRALFHRLLMQGWPILRYIGGVAGHRASAVALLREGFWCGVIPGGADEAMTGHEDCYKLYWPTKRKGFARVAMDGGAMLVPFFVKNVEEARYNPFFHIWHLLHGWVPYEYLRDAQIPYLSAFVYTMGEVIWFSFCMFCIPLPVRCTAIFADPVSYDPDEPVEAVVQRCHDALQKLINEVQPNAQQGRNYTRALGERWAEWRVSHPKTTSTIEGLTPTFVKRYLQRQAAGGKKRQ